MQTAGVAMVRDEADIIEAFVRHNAARLGLLAIVDHASVDGTSDILRALVDEGLPLTVERSDAVAQLQPETLSRLARDRFRGGADVVFALDADEFLKIPDAARLNDAIAAIPAGLHAALHWQTYVPHSGAAADVHPFVIATLRRATERHGLYKVALMRHFAASPDAMLGPGSHMVTTPSATSPARIARIAPEVVALAHIPVRSAAQLARKVRTGWAAHRAAGRENPDLAFHWRELAQEVDMRGTPTPERLVEIAVNYGLPMAAWEPAAGVALVDDPLPITDTLRYSYLARIPTATGTGCASARRLAL